MILINISYIDLCYINLVTIILSENVFCWVFSGFFLNILILVRLSFLLLEKCMFVSCFCGFLLWNFCLFCVYVCDGGGIRVMRVGVSVVSVLFLFLIVILLFFSLYVVLSLNKKLFGFMF